MAEDRPGAAATGRTGRDVLGGELARRFVVAAIGIPLAVVLVWQGSWYLGAGMALVAGVGAREFFDLAEAGGGRPLQVPGIVAAVLLPLVATLHRTFTGTAAWSFGLILLLGLGALGGAVWLRGVEGRPMSAGTATVTGALYTGGTLAFAILLRHLPETVATVETSVVHGGFLVAFPITVTWIADSSAYFAGRRWGRRKLVPRVSPGKTVVGGVAGLLGATVTSVLFAVFFLDREGPLAMGLGAAAVIGAVLGIVAQVGDLTASVLKREAGVKDSGTILPGHGGVLDRFDALFFTIPLGYLLLVLNASL